MVKPKWGLSPFFLFLSADRQIAAQASIRLAEAQRELQAATTREQDTAADRQTDAAAAFSSVSSPAIPATEGGTDNRRLRAIAAYREINELLTPRPAV